MPFRKPEKHNAATHPTYIRIAFPMPWSPERWPGWVLRVLAPSRRVSTLLLRASRRVLGGTGVFLLQLEQALAMASLREWQRNGWWGVVCRLEALERSLAASGAEARKPAPSRCEARPATPRAARSGEQPAGQSTGQSTGQPAGQSAQTPSTRKRREAVRPQPVEPVS